MGGTGADMVIHSYIIAEEIYNAILAVSFRVKLLAVYYYENNFWKFIYKTPPACKKAPPLAPQSSPSGPACRAA